MRMKQSAAALARISQAFLVLLILVIVADAKAEEAAFNPWELKKAKGYVPEMHSASDLDSVNLFNGSLNLAIPLGQRYPVSSVYSYGLTLHYNSNAYEIRYRRHDSSGNSQFSPFGFPNSDATAGVGFQLHLGRLFQRADFSDFDSLPERERERRVHPSFNWEGDWVYLAPDGSLHPFHKNLHGESQSDEGVFYTRDGTYLRLRPDPVITALTRIEFPDGTVHQFQKKEPASWGDSLPDEWRLVSISDRAGNTLSIGHNVDDCAPKPCQLLSDPHGRKQKIRLEGAAWHYLRIKEVELTAIGGQTAKYGFNYENIEFTRTNGDTGQLIEEMVSRLSSIRLPDQTTYAFAYDTEGGTGDWEAPGRIAELILPTGGKIAWEYTDTFLPSTEDCSSGGIDGGTPKPPQHYVGRRQMLSAAGEVAEQTFFPRYMYTSPLVPTDFCSRLEVAEFDVLVPPPAVLEVGTLRQYSATNSTLTVNYFSVWPFSIEQAALAGGWKGEEFGLPFTRDDPRWGQFLSEATYDCPFISAQPRADVRALAPGCTKLRSRYVAMQGEYGNCMEHAIDGIIFPPTFNCRALNAFTTFESTVFHDDGDKYIQNKHAGNDGLGHLRTTVQTGSVSSSDYLERETNYNAGSKELILTADGLIALNSTFVKPLPSAAWNLDTYTRKTLSDDAGRSFVSRYCFNASGLLRRVRVYANGASDGEHDVVTEYIYASGNPTKMNIYGGDKQQLPTGNGCNGTFTDPQQSTLNTYQYGVLKTSKLEGSTTTLVDGVSIDNGTGLVTSARDSTGMQTASFSYDVQGRLTLVTRSVGANTVVSYSAPGTFWPEVTASMYKNGTSSGSGNLLSQLKVVHDEFGRDVREFTLQPSGLESVVQTVYGAALGGKARKRTTPQTKGSVNSSWATTFAYDALGRLVTETRPDGSTTTYGYRGARQTTVTVNVSGSNAATTTRYDRHGRSLEVATPLHTTSYVYDPRGMTLSATRGVQTRSYGYDGRGFLQSETLPEKGWNGNASVFYSDYDALGNAGRVQDGWVDRVNEFDPFGRLITVRHGYDGWVYLQNTYGSSGHANGKVVLAVRYNFLTPANSGGAFPANEVLKVSYADTYSALGLVARTTEVVLNKSLAYLAKFTQAWGYDDLGNVTAVTYPTCATVWCTSTSRELTRSFKNGGLTSVSSSSTAPSLGANVSYHSNGQVNQISHFNGLTDTYGVGTGNMARVSSVKLASGGLDLGAYSHDGAGNITKIGGDSYLYDLNSRLTRGYIPGPPSNDYRDYTYDAYDNIVTKGPDNLQPNSTTNRLGAYNYDSAGNLVKVGTIKLYYDIFGQQESMVWNESGAAYPCDPSGTTGKCWQYLYGPDGQRVGVGAMPPPSQATPSLYVHKWTWTIRDLDGSILRTYENAESDLSQVDDYIYIGRRLVATRATSGGTVRYYHSDHLASPRADSDGSGQLVGTRHFMPEGTPSGTDGVQERIVNWAGYEKDPNELTHTMGARSYYNGWGRFFTPDPARDGWNLYSYAYNNPLVYVDPTGTTGEATQPAVMGTCGINMSCPPKQTLSNWSLESELEAQENMKNTQRTIGAQRGLVSNNQTPRSGTLRAQWEAVMGPVPEGWEVDHIIDLQLGGADDLSNAQLVRKPVNRSSGARTGNALRGVPKGAQITSVKFRPLGTIARAHPILEAVQSVLGIVDLADQRARYIEQFGKEPTVVEGMWMMMGVDFTCPNNPDCT